MRVGSSETQSGRDTGFDVRRVNRIHAGPEAGMDRRGQTGPRGTQDFPPQKVKLFLLALRADFFFPFLINCLPKKCPN